MKNRIDFVGRELEKVGVSIRTYSADGDARELKYEGLATLIFCGNYLF